MDPWAHPSSRGHRYPDVLDQIMAMWACLCISDISGTRWRLLLVQSTLRFHQAAMKPIGNSLEAALSPKTSEVFGDNAACTEVYERMTTASYLTQHG